MLKNTFVICTSALGGGPQETFLLDEKKEAHLDQLNANDLVYPNSNDTDQPPQTTIANDQENHPVPSEESNSMDHVENQDEVLTDSQRLELSTSSTNDLTEKDVQSKTKAPATSKSKRIDVRNIQFFHSIFA